jgi:S1 RNA binding domain protein
MSVEIGKVVDGVVSGITAFGAFVQLPDKKTGLCHISEIANDYVKNVSEHLKAEQPVKVKIIGVDEKGKISLSIKQADESAQPVKKSFKPAAKSNEKAKFKSEKKDFKPRRNDGGDRKFDNRPKAGGGGFENMLSSFLKDSDDKLREVKKAAKSSRKGNGYSNNK